MISSADVLDRLDDLVRARSILAHPFYVRWRGGELNRRDLATYARVYYPHVAAFPGYLETAIHGATDAASRTVLADNLVDELRAPAPHADLWLDFAHGVGAARDEIRGAAPVEGAAVTVGTFRRLCEAGTASAVAALYAYESQQPEVAAAKARDLREIYGLADPRAVAYFDVHAAADVEHAAGEREILRRSLAAGTDVEEILGAAREALDAYWGLLDAVCEELPAVA